MPGLFTIIAAASLIILIGVAAYKECSRFHEQRRAIMERPDIGIEEFLSLMPTGSQVEREAVEFVMEAISLELEPPLGKLRPDDDAFRTLEFFHGSDLDAVVILDRVDADLKKRGFARMPETNATSIADLILHVSHHIRTARATSAKTR